MPWYYGWNIIGAGMAFQAMAFGLTFYTFGLWVLPWAEEFGSSRGEIMIGYTLVNITMGLLSPFVGHAMDSKSIRALVSIGIVTISAGLVLVSFGASIVQVLAVYATLVAVGAILAGPLGASTLAAKWFRARRSLAFGISATGTSLGGLTLPPLAALLLANFGWRGAHQIIAALAIVCIIPLVWMVVSNSPKDRGVEPEPEASHRDGKPTKGAADHLSWTTGMLLRERNFWITALAFGTLTMAFSGVLPNLIPIAQDAGIDAQKASILVSILAGAGMIGKACFGYAADHIDVRRLFWCAAAFLAAALCTFLATTGFAGLVLGAIFMGVSSGGFIPLQGTIVGSRFGPAAFGQVMGLLAPFTMPLALLGPPVAGYIYDYTGSYELAFEVFIGIVLMAVMIISFLRPLPSMEALQSAQSPSEIPRI